MADDQQQHLDPTKVALEAKKMVDVLYQGFKAMESLVKQYQAQHDADVARIKDLQSQNEKLVKKLLGDDIEESKTPGQSE